MTLLRRNITEFEQHCKRLFTKKFAAFMRVASIVHSLLKV